MSMKTKDYLFDLFAKLKLKDNEIRYAAFLELLEITESPVNWVYDYWDELVGKLNSDNSFHRTIGLQLLANLTKSDSQMKMFDFLTEYVNHFEDDKFITSSQCINFSWKIAIVNDNYCRRIIDELEYTYYENKHNNSHANLIKREVIYALLKIWKIKREKSVYDLVNKLVNSETDAKIIKTLNKVINTNKD